jgi:hypothetical protein
MKTTLNLLKEFCEKTNCNISIRIFSDGSGCVLDGFDEELYEFENLKQLKQYLKNN